MIEDPAPRIPDTMQAGEPGLTRRAGYTFVTRALQDATRIVASFFVTPLIITGLGAELYGAWAMIQQIVSYLANYDVRAQGTLKLRLAILQGSRDHGRKRRLVGAALSLFLFTLPVLILVGGVLVSLCPRFITVQASNAGQIRMALAICIANLAIGRLFALPGNVLRGENMEFRSGGLVALAIAAEALLMLCAIEAGFGLPGLALMSISGLLLSGVIQLVVLLRSVPWFGVNLPSRTEIWEFTRVSIWILISGLAHLLLNASDVLLIGILISPSAAAVYAATGAAVRFSLYPLSQLLSSGNAGIGSLCGTKDWIRLQKLRSEMIVFSLFGCSVIAGPVVALNSAFVPLWVGGGFFAGAEVTLLLTASAVLTSVLAVDSLILDSLLRFRTKAMLLSCGGVLSLILAVAFSRSFGMGGIVLGICCGKLAALLLQQQIMRSSTPLWSQSPIHSRLRPVSCCIILAAAGYLSQSHIRVENWLDFLPAACAAGIFSTGFFALFGLTAAQRQTLLERAGTFLKKGGHNVH